MNPNAKSTVNRLLFENQQLRKIAADNKRQYVQLCDILRDLGMNPEVLIQTHRAFEEPKRDTNYVDLTPEEVEAYRKLRAGGFRP